MRYEIRPLGHWTDRRRRAGGSADPWERLDAAAGLPGVRSGKHAGSA